MTAPYIILGAHGGIGEDLAIRLAKGGMTVIGTMRDPTQASAALSSIRMEQLDINNTDHINTMIQSADAGDGIAGIAYCIGSIDLHPFKMARDQKIIDAVNLNVIGAVRVLQAAEAGLKKARGSVVLFSSIAAQQGFSNHATIAIAKAGVEGLTRSLAAEWAPDIRVNCIAPSLSDTPLAARFTGNEKMATSIAASHPIPRLGTAADSASLAAYLLGPDSGWITGQILHVDGGRSHLRVRD